MPADLTPFRQMIIRISNEADEFYGVGCLLNPHQAITCAHVVADALGYERHIDSAPPGKIRINRPFAEDSIHSITAQVEDWYPRGEHKLSDMALLQLDEPLTELVSLKLSYSMNLTGICFKAWGGPAGHEIHLIDIEGIIGSPISNGRYRLDVKDSNYKIEKGCSGAPVVDVETGQVLGLIAQEELDPDIPAGFLIPATHWRQTGWFPEQNAGEGLEPLKVWLNNRFKLCSLERRGIEEFVDYYTGTDENPMPFAGRSEELRHLDNWLAQNQGRLLLLSGSAGRGKSALLLHWLAQLIRQPLPDLTILFLPISIRFETSNELEGLRLLHAALCDYFADLRFSPGDKPDTHDYRQKLSEGWDRIANRPNQLYLLVIDGIDESANDWLLNKVLPRKSSANLHVLLSARHLSRETDGKSWFQKLNISGELLELPLLTQSAISKAIIQLGRPLDELAERETFVKELYRLTDQGDPLLLNLWIGQIWQYRETAPQIKIEQLQQLKPSLASFYGKWLEDQEKIWKKQSIDDVDSSDFNQLMQVLASAYGPLLLKELVSLQKQVRQLQEEETADIWLSWDQVKLRKILTTSSRLVIGDGEKKGFSLVHPRLNDYFQTELANEPAYQRQVHEAYLNWGSEVVARLNQNKLMPDSCPRYLLHHYTEHVAAAPTTVAHLKLRDVLEKYWLPLLEGGWHQAWEAYEGAWNGFLSDLQRVLQALRQYNQACYERGERAAMKLAAEVRCALILASIHTLSQNVPTELVVQLVKNELWSLPRAERVAIQFEARKEVDCLVGLAKIVLPKDKARLLQRALTVVGNVQDERSRAEALIMLAPLLEDEPRQQALTITGNIQNKWFRAKALIILLPLLTGEAHQQVLQQVLTTIGNIHSERDRTNALTMLAPLLENELSQQVLQQALTRVLTIAGNIQDKWFHTKALIALLPLLRGEAHQQVLQQILSAIENIQSGRSCTNASTKLAPLLHGKTRQKVLQQSIANVENIQDKEYYIQVLAILAPWLDGKQRQQVLQQISATVENVQNKKHHAKILTMLIPRLVDEPDLLQRALIAVEKIKDEYRSKVLISLIYELDNGQHQKILQQVLTAIRNIKSEKYRTEVLIKLASQLADAPYLLQQTLISVENIKNEKFRVRVLSALVPLLVEKTGLQKDFLKMVLALSDKRERIIISAKLIHNNFNLLTYSLWADWLDHAPLKRSELFEVTGELCTAAIQLTGNPQEANEIARAVMDVVRWWP